ncbi:hypothetical protein EC988_007121 [Linderina pennispora]|nr:hypothetical protein EC988_007121 [Linderina pennispora]
MPYTTQVMQVDRTQQFGSYPEPQQVFAIDVPGARAIQQQQMTTEYLSYHRDSESASSVSSQGTLMDSRVSPIHHTYKRTSIYQQHQQQSQHQQYVQQPFASTPAAEADRNMCEEDVFTAASILMSLRTCKMPC